MTNSSFNVLYSNCRESWPSEICAIGNVFGLIYTGLWFIVFLPQIYRNFRHKTVEGLSPYWIIVNFTAALMNLFFTFKWGALPLFIKVSACYSPVIQATMLFQIIIFTPKSLRKIIAIIVCVAMWLAIVLLEVFLSTYDWLQWISVILWSYGTFPQVNIYLGCLELFLPIIGFRFF